MSLIKTIRQTPTTKTPKWLSEHVELKPDMRDLVLMTLNQMAQIGRARNIMTIAHSGKEFVQFERKLGLKFKAIKNAIKP